MKKLILLICLIWTGLTFAGVEEGITAYKNKDYELALKELQPLADQGNPDAQYWLGRMYGEGNGVAKNHEEALRLYILAIRKNHGRSQAQIGVYYLGGLGVPEDKVIAIKWMMIAETSDDAEAREVAKAFIPVILGTYHPFERPAKKREAEIAAQKWIDEWKANNKK